MDVQSAICAGAVILIGLAVIIFILWNMKPFSTKKRTEGTNTALTVTAKRNLDKVTVIARFGNEEVNFERKRVKKGQSIEFVYPSSKKPAKLIVEVGSGHVLAAEV